MIIYRLKILNLKVKVNLNFKQKKMKYKEILLEYQKNLQSIHKD